MAGAFFQQYSKLSVPIPLAGLRKWLTSDFGITKDVSNFTSNWADKNGTGDASQPTGSAQPLWVDNQLNGKPILKLDGINDNFLYSEISNARSIFIVAKHATGTQDYASIIGSTTSYDFHGAAGTALWGGGYASVTGGKCYENGYNIDPQMILKPTAYSIISLIPLGNVSCSTIGNDRNNAARFWNGDIAEIIIYDSEKTQAERQQIETYLSLKYSIPIAKNLVPIMTSDIAPIGIASASSIAYYNTEAYRAFNGIANYWLSNGNVNEWLKYQFDVAKIVTGYRIVPVYSIDIPSLPNTFSLQGSNDDSSWTTLDSQAGITWSGSSGKNFFFANTTAYTYYRLFINSNGGFVNIAIKELELY